MPPMLQTPSPSNRYVGWPYTKAEVSVMDVDMAAALLLMSGDKADALGVPDDDFLVGDDLNDLADEPAPRGRISIREPTCSGVMFSTRTRSSAGHHRG